MKRVMLFLLGLGFIDSEIAVAQKIQHSVGVLGSTLIVPSNWFDASRVGKNPYGFSSGLFFDWNFSSNFGLSIAPSQKVVIDEQQNWCWACIQINPPTIRKYFYYFDLPVNLNLKLTSKETASWKTYFSLGYAYSYLYLGKARDLSAKTQQDVDLRWEIRHLHALNFGVEVRHNLSENYTLGLGPSVRIDLSSEIGYPIPAFNFKVGRIL